MELLRQKGFRRFWTQYSILTWKNYVVFKRKWPTTALLVLSPLFFVFLIYIIDLAFNSSPTIRSQRTPVTSYSPETFWPLARCTPPPGKSSCYTIAYAPNAAPIPQLISDVQTQFSIPSSEIIGFSTVAAMDDFIYKNQNLTQAGYQFFENPVLNGSARSLSYILTFNNSVACRRPGDCNDPYQGVAAPMMYAMDRALMQESFSATLNVDLVAMPRKELAKIDVVGTFGQFFFFLAIMFLFLVFSNLVVQEKEKKLRLSLKVMGLRQLPYWLSWMTTAFSVLLLTVLVLVASGAAFQFKFFLLNNFFLYFFLFYLTGMGIVLMSFILAVFVHRTKVATPLGFALFLIFYLCNILASNIVYSPNISVPSGLQVFCALFAPILFAKGLNDLATAVSGTGSNGISWASRNSYTNIYPLPTLYLYALLDIAIYLVIIWYFDNVVSGEFGTGHPFYFCFTPSYWTGRSRGKKPRQHTQQEDSLDDDVARSVYAEDVDVKAERLSVENGAPDRHLAIKVLHMEKFFPNAGMCARGGYRAVRGVTFGVNEGELFCLLGPNGAGKSTTQNMLIGVHTITRGQAWIGGYEVGVEWDDIRRLMGVCPQHDILWYELTSAEHLRMFAVLKGVPPHLVEEEVTRRLKQVDLEDVRDTPVGTYSGGMQRRVSIAIAFVGDPKVVFLDEVSTGLDVVVRRQIWDLIQEAKTGRTIVLTTHSMEEADTLGDRICIIGKGRLRVVGSSVRLKNRFGAGYRLMFIDEDHRSKDEVKAFMTANMPSAHMVSEVGGVLTYEIPRTEKDRLPQFFEYLERNPLFQKRVDYSLSMTTLEEVFIRISQESRQDEARYELATSVASDGVPRPVIMAPAATGTVATLQPTPSQKPSSS